MEKSAQVAEKRQSLYKANSSTPPWKDAYRKRCQDRLKTSRAKFLERSRGTSLLCGDAAAEGTNSVVEDLMHEEWKILQRERQGPQTEDTGSPQPQDDEYMAIFQEIRAELIREEQQILLEYEAALHHEQAQTESFLTLPDAVLCPVCQRSPLHINHGVVFCSCGIRVDTEQDCISLDNIRSNLAEGLQLHDPACSGQAQYRVDVMFNNILMTCSICDYMHIIV